MAAMMTMGDKGKRPLEDTEPRTNDTDPIYPPGFTPPHVQERLGDYHQRGGLNTNQIAAQPCLIIPGSSTANPVVPNLEDPIGTEKIKAKEPR